MITFEAETFDDVHRGILAELLHDPEYVGGAKGSIMKEALSVMIRIRDPRGRITASEAHAMEYGPAVGSFVRSIYSGTKTYRQRREIIAKLAANPSTRDAVSTEPTGSMHFFIRNNRLHMHVTIQHTDALWGLAMYVFTLTMVQEVIMLSLRERYPTLDLGECVFSVASLYLYERHFDTAAEAIIEDGRPPVRMPALDKVEDLIALAEDEDALREKRPVTEGGYSGAAGWMFDKLLSYRMLKDKIANWAKPDKTVTN